MSVLLSLALVVAPLQSFSAAFNIDDSFDPKTQVYNATFSIPVNSTEIQGKPQFEILDVASTEENLADIRTQIAQDKQAAQQRGEQFLVSEVSFISAANPNPELVLSSDLSDKVIQVSEEHLLKADVAADIDIMAENKSRRLALVSARVVANAGMVMTVLLLFEGSAFAVAGATALATAFMTGTFQYISPVYTNWFVYSGNFIPGLGWVQKNIPGFKKIAKKDSFLTTLNRDKKASSTEYILKFWVFDVIGYLLPIAVVSNLALGYFDPQNARTSAELAVNLGLGLTVGAAATTGMQGAWESLANRRQVEGLESSNLPEELKLAYMKEQFVDRHNSLADFGSDLYGSQAYIDHISSISGDSSATSEVAKIRAERAKARYRTATSYFMISVLSNIIAIPILTFAKGWEEVIAFNALYSLFGVPALYLLLNNKARARAAPYLDKVLAVGSSFVNLFVKKKKYAAGSNLEQTEYSVNTVAGACKRVLR